MAEPQVPDNARGAVRSSTFWGTPEGREETAWRRGWWDAYEGKPCARAPSQAYERGHAEYLEHFAPGRVAGRKPRMQLTERPLRELKDHPLNPRTRTEQSVAEMKSSIEHHGLLQPLVVKPDGTVLLGHRRKWAMEELGWPLAPCNVVDGESEGKALELLLIGNKHIEPPDALKESDAVAELLAQPGWTLSAIADALGRSVKWVARRAQFRNLSPRLRESIAAGKLFAGWPVEWIEQVAILSKSAQETLAKRFAAPSTWDRPKVTSLRELEALLAEELHVLGKAPFEIHDAELVPRAGPCVAKEDGGSSCKKTTISRAGLFDDSVEGDAKTARCCDAACWAGKIKADVGAKLEKAKTEHGDLVVVGPRVDRDHGADAHAALKDVNALSPYQVTEVKGTDKGAKAAAFVEADGSVREGFVRQQARASDRFDKPKKTKEQKAKEDRTDAQRLKDSRELVERRRKAHVVDSVGEAVRSAKTPAPALDVVLRFVAGYETKAPFRDGYGNHFHGDVKRAKHFAAVPDDPEAFAKQLWARVSEAVSASISRHSSHDLDGEYVLAKWIAEQIGLDGDDLDLQAYDAVPAPKFWPAGTDEPPKRSKSVKKRKPPAAKKGTCEKCGCTETTPCDDGMGPCAWVNLEQTRCTVCFPGELPKSAKAATKSKKKSKTKRAGREASPTYGGE